MGSFSRNLDGIRAFEESTTIRVDFSVKNEQVAFRFVQFWQAGLASSHYAYVRTGWYLQVREVPALVFRSLHCRQPVRDLL